MCPNCGALERHRLTWLYFKRCTNLFSEEPGKVLHIAPENCFEARLRKWLGGAYITADINNPNAMVRMDIMDIHYPDQSFDIIYCSHVLEHVLDDKKALRELFRVLKRGGWAVILVPIYSNETFEDSSVIDPLERRRLFGQDDHVRRYGPDFIARLQEAGFVVAKTRVSDLVNKNEEIRLGLTAASGDIFCCTK